MFNIIYAIVSIVCGCVSVGFVLVGRAETKIREGQDNDKT